MIHAETFELVVASDTEADFQAAVKLAVGDRERVWLYRLDPQGRHITFLWGAPDTTNAVKLPYSMNAQQAADFAWGWLMQFDWKEFGDQEPDTDGSTTKGFRITVHAPIEDHDPLRFYSVFCVKPQWMVYGK